MRTTFERVKDFVRGVFGKVQNRMKPSTIEELLGVELLLSSKMRTSIRLWDLVYQNIPPWANKDIKGGNMAAAIASEMTRLVITDFEVQFTETESSGTERAKTLASVWKDILSPNLRTYVEYGVALGGGIFKPYVDDYGRIGIDFVGAGNFYPTHYTPAGDIDGAVFPTERVKGETVYYLLEYQHLEGDRLVIENTAYKGTTLFGETNWQPIELATVDEWAHLEPEVFIENINHPLFAYFKMPLANNVDTSSPLGASVFSRALAMLEDYDYLYNNYNWEFESGKRAIYVDENAFAVDEKTGERLIPNERLYRKLRNIGSDDKNKLFEDFTPTFRESDLSNGMNQLLMRIEDSCGLARGTYSLLTYATAKTATELKISLQRSFHTVVDVQHSLEMCLDRLFGCIDVLSTLYSLDSGGKFTTLYNFGDSVLDDPDKEFQRRMAMLTARIIKDWEFYMWYFKVDEETAKEHANEFSDALFGVDN